VSLPAPSRRRQGAKVDLWFDTRFEVMHRVKQEELKEREAEEAQARVIKGQDIARQARENEARREEEARLRRAREDIDFDEHIAKVIGVPEGRYEELLAIRDPDIAKPRHFLRLCSEGTHGALTQIAMAAGAKVDIIKSFEIHNPTLWERYSRARAGLQEASSSIKRENSNTAAHCEAHEFLGKLDPAINEFPLWHGTGTAAGAGGICSTGFDTGFVGSACGTVWGHGFYFADSASTSTGYGGAGFSVNPKYANVKVLFLCRVLCGNVKKTRSPPDAEQKEKMVAECLGPGGNFGPKSAYHSILGASWAFVCAHNHQVYPSYMILYR